MTKNYDAFDRFLIRCEPEMSSTQERYVRLRNKLIKFFVWKGCEDPESLADETIGRLISN